MKIGFDILNEIINFLIKQSNILFQIKSLKIKLFILQNHYILKNILF